MKKIIIIFLCLIMLIFLLPALFTKTYNMSKELINNKYNDNVENKNNTDETVQEDNEKINNYDYKQYTRIKLLHTKTNQVEELPLDEYLLGVVSAEMPATYEQEALNAQALVARTYTIYSISHNQSKHENADICDDSACCQAWISKEDRMNRWDENAREENWKKIVKAVNATSGKVITYNGEVIDAFFHANSGGETEIPVNVWGGTNYPYLQSVQTSGEDAYSQYSSEVTLSKDSFIEKVKSKHSNFSINFQDSDCIKITEYTESGRVKNIKIGNLNLSGVEVRGLIGLKSTNFTVNIENENIKFEVTGYGHGVGMSQTGADSMAKQGNNYEEIVKHFYTGIEITEM